MSTMMQAMVLHAHGGPGHLELRTVETPQPGPGQVRVRVYASSVNPIDCKIRAGLPIGAALPAILGCDFSGVVDGLGDGATAFTIGDEVYGCAGGVRGLGGSLAEYIVCDPASLACKPKTLSHREAAALPLVTITAWELNERAGVGAGHHVLVHGGVGGVGHVAVQLAKVRGARVASTVRNAAAAAIVRGFGADDTIEFEHEDVPGYVQRLTHGNGFSVVIDTVGGPNLDRSLQAAATGGTVAVCAARSTHDLSPMHAKALSLHAVFVLLPLLGGQGRARHGDILREVASLCDQGWLRPLLDPTRFTLAQAAQAHAKVEDGSATGKVVVDVVLG